MFNHKKDPLKEYTDVTSDFSNRELKLSRWYLKHKILLGQIGIGILIVFCITTIFYSSIMWGLYLFSGFEKDEQLRRDQVAEFVDNRAIYGRFAATPLIIDSPKIFQEQGDKVTFSSNVSNPNNRHIATVTYRFTYSGGQTDLEEAIILPASKRPLSVFGHQTTNRPTTIRLQIENVKWQKINPHEIPDPVEYINDHFSWQIENFNFVRGSVLDNMPSHQISFDISNNSVYSYWAPQFYIELLDIDQIVGVLKVELEQFRSGETRTVDIRSLTDLQNVTDLSIYPIVDPFDQTEIIPPGR